MGQLWRMVDADGSGSVDMEEFVVWYGQYFYKDPSKGEVDNRSPIEIFYSLLGSDRLNTSMDALDSELEAEARRSTLADGASRSSVVSPVS